MVRKLWLWVLYNGMLYTVLRAARNACVSPRGSLRYSGTKIIFCFTSFTVLVIVGNATGQLGALEVFRLFDCLAAVV